MPKAEEMLRKVKINVNKKIPKISILKTVPLHYLLQHLQWKIDEDIKGLRTWKAPDFILNLIHYGFTGYTKAGHPSMY